MSESQRHTGSGRRGVASEKFEAADAGWDESLQPILTPALRARVKRLQLQTSRRMSNAMSGAFRSTFRGSGIEFEEVRPYQPGDDVRAIDWKVTARARKAHIKTYREERQLRVHLCVDASASMDFGSTEATKREKAAELAALLSAAAETSRDLVSLDLFAQESLEHLPAASGSGQTLRVLRAVMGARGAGQANLPAAIEAMEQTLRRHALVFVVSDFRAPADQDWWSPLARLGRTQDVVCARVTDPFERELPRIGRVRMLDPETGFEREVDTSSKRVRARWSELAAERDQRFREACLRARATPIELDTAQSSADPLLSLFQRRARRGGGAA